MRLSVCLLDLQGLPDEREQLNTLALSLPFGEAERDRLMAKNNLIAFKQSLGGLLALKELLTQKGIAPMTIVRSDVGKPYFENTASLPFSISHAASLAVAVLGEGSGKVGVDLEFPRPNLAVSELSDRFFGKSEREAMKNAKDKTDAFLWLWTKKEAAAKCAGAELTRFFGKENPPYLFESYSLQYRDGQAYLTLCADSNPTEVSFLCVEKDWMIKKI